MPKLSAETKRSSLHRVPGEVTYVGKKNNELNIEIIDYDANNYEQIETKNFEDTFLYKDTETVSWININGLNKTDEINKLGAFFNISPLVLEDIADTEQRPKIEEHSNYVFIALKMLYHDEKNTLIKEHLGIVLGKNYVLTFQEANADVFDSIRDRIKNTKGRIRAAGADYLMYAILDAVVDNYFVITDNINKKAQELESELFVNARSQNNITVKIQQLKRGIMRIRKAVFPLREVIKQLEKSQHEFINKKTRHFIRDLSDHIVQVCEDIDTYREIIWGLMQLYMTSISNKMNEIMKLLTIVSIIFVPLTFIVGVYGMNFKNMPELDTQYGYFIVWGVMILIFLLMLLFFKRKKWL